MDCRQGDVEAAPFILARALDLFERRDCLVLQRNKR